MFVEYITDNKANRFTILPLGEIDPHKGRQYEAYISIMPYDREILDHMKATKDEAHPRGNVAGYQGKVFCRWIYWDFDGPINAPKQAMADARELCNLLVTKYGVPSNDVGIYFSGGKGFHITISSAHIGGVDPATPDVMAEKLGIFTERLVDDCAGTMETFDSSLYAPNRYFRLPNSRHPSTGLYKIPLAYEELMEMEPKDVLEAAEIPRVNFSYQFSRKVLPKRELQKVWMIVDAGEILSGSAKQALAELPEDEAGLFAKAVELAHEKYSQEEYFEHNRNNFTFVLAAWCNDLGIGKAGDGSRALELIKGYRANVLKDDPATWDEKRIEQTVSNAYRRLRQKYGRRRSYLRKKAPHKSDVRAQFTLEEKVLSMANKLRPKALLEVALALNATAQVQLPEETVEEIVLKYVRGHAAFKAEDMPKPIYAYASDFVDKSQRTENSKGLGFDFIDKEENYDYEGKVIHIIGTGGIGKSLVLKQICTHSALSAERCVYSTMEDTALRLFERVIRMHTDPHYKVDPETGEVIDYLSAVKRLQYLARTEGKTLKEALSRLLQREYGDYFLIDERVGMDKPAYVATIEWLLNKYGQLHKLCIDGLSTMGGGGNEIDRAISNSFDVKELANEYKLCIPLLVHTPGGVDPEARDLWNHERGGPKIKDNADLFVALSAVKDPLADAPGKEQYYQDKIIMKYWGKRTSGARKQRLLELDAEKLYWKVTDLEDFDPRDDVF